MNKIGRLFFDIIASVFDENAKARLPKTIPDEILKVIYKTSSKQDISHITAEGLERAGLLTESEIGKLFSKQKLTAIFRREQLNTEEAKICALLSENGIDHIPLKGAVIRKLYPEEWLRQSCDIDILIHDFELERAISLITESLGYRDEGRSYHDHSLIAENGVHLELHFSITENNADSDAILERVWDFALPDNGHKYSLSNEFLMFQMIAHAKFHFKSGGCGIRQILDLWILENTLEYNKNELDKMLSDSKNGSFYEAVRKLISVWFENKEHDSLTADMEKFILSGGTFGTNENKALVGQHKSGGKKKYVISRVFMPKSELEIAYPRLKDNPVLLPYYEVKRWFGLMNSRGLSNAKGEISAKDDNSFGDMFDKLNL